MISNMRKPHCSNLVVRIDDSIRVLSEHMVFMIKISISKEDYIPSSEEFGHILTSVIIFS